MKIKRKRKIILSTLLALIICLTILPQNVYASEDEWEAIEDTFTLEALQRFFPDTGKYDPEVDGPVDPNPNDGFAVGVYNSIKDAILYDAYQIDKENILDSDGYNNEWPEPLTLEEIIESEATGDELVEAILLNYCGPINASKLNIRDITGYRYLKNTTSIDFQRNLIEDLSVFTGEAVGGSYNFNSNPVHIWPVHFPDTVRAATHGVPTSFSVTTAPLAYRFGEVVTPSMTYNVYYPNPETLNTAWYFKSWSQETAYATPPPTTLTTNELGGITLPTLQKEGQAVIEIGLTGLKTGETEEEVNASTANAVNYISGMDIVPEKSGGGIAGGTPGQGNSPSYRFGVQVQRYATIKIEDNTKVTGGFKFTKTDAATDAAVSGAEYKLYTEDGTFCVDGSFTTDENGVIEQDGLAPGRYYLKETKAPAGYAINTDPVWIEIVDPGATTTVTGGVSSFERDDINPNLKAVWGTKQATNGEWEKMTKVTTETATTLKADAILTNRGNVNYAVLSALTVQPKSNADAYDIEVKSIKVQMAGAEYGTYTSDAEALTAINNIVKNKKLTGDITIVYETAFTEKEVSASAIVGQQDEPLPTYSLKITKNDETGDILKGAGFKIYSDEECTTLADVYADSEKTKLIKDVEDSTLRTDEEGILRFYGLMQSHTYYLKEVYAPTGYGLKEIVKITVDDDGVVMVNGADKTPEPGEYEISITVTDTVLALNLPTTGLGGSLLLIAVGTLIILVTSAGFMLLRKKDALKSSILLK